MITTDKKDKFIGLRARGNSFDKIAKELGVSKPTLIKWSLELQDDISNHRSIELDNLRKQYCITTEYRLELLSKQLRLVSKVLEERDLNDVSSEKLLLLQLRLLAHIESEDKQLRLTCEVPLEDTLKLTHTAKTVV